MTMTMTMRVIIIIKINCNFIVKKMEFQKTLNLSKKTSNNNDLSIKETIRKKQRN